MTFLNIDKKHFNEDLFETRNYTINKVLSELGLTIFNRSLVCGPNLIKHERFSWSSSWTLFKYDLHSNTVKKHARIPRQKDKLLNCRAI